MNQSHRRPLAALAALLVGVFVLRAPGLIDAQDHSAHVKDPHAGHKMPDSEPAPTSKPAKPTSQGKGKPKPKPKPEPTSAVEHADHVGHADHAEHAAHADQADHADHSQHADHAPAAPAASATLSAPPGGGAAQVWTCPMHPQIIQEEPGSCPICGMDLVPKEIEGASGSAGAAADTGTAPVIGIDPVVVQNMGIRTALVQRGNISRAIRTVGSVVVAEDRLSVVNLRFSGWIEKIFVDETGVRVKKGQHLFEVYSPELVTAQQEYLLALRASGPASGLAKSARLRLHYLGIPDWQIERMKDAKEVRPTLVVTAPRDGHVVHKNVLAGARVASGQDLYRIADLSRIWIDAEVYEFDAPWVKVGSPATIALTYRTGARPTATVTFIHPTLDPRTRTLRVRLELDNADLTLRPGMFATVQIEAERKSDRLVIPTEAVIHSGLRELVFVAQSLGRYEARELETGLVGDNHVTEVLAGLSQGERVVTSGQFMLDSESQLREAVQKMLSARLHANDPDAKQPAGGTGAGAPEGERESGTYWTCSMHPQIVQDGPGTCPICGMDLVEKKR